MGYEVHITRNPPPGQDRLGISLEDWLEVVASDSEMRSDGFAEAQTPEGDVIRIEGPGIAVWTAYSGHGVDGNMAWFCHFRDRVTVKNPDAEIRRKMHQIAVSMEAIVQGDEGETYGANGEESERTARDSGDDRTHKRRWWEFWR